MGDFQVVAGAGTLAVTATNAVHFPHRWTSGGVTVDCAFSGAHLLHLATAGCVLNDVYREAERLGVTVRGVRVIASGGFDLETWRSTGIEYSVEVDGPGSPDELRELLQAVDSAAEIPRAIRAGASVWRGP